MKESRRDVLKGLGGGALAVTGLETARRVLDGQEESLEESAEDLLELATPFAEVKASSAAGGQFMGDSMNTGYLGAGITPTGVKKAHRKPSQDFVWRSPTASSQGVFAAPYEGRVEVLDNKANLIQEFSATGRPSHVVFDGNTVSWADGEAIKGFDYNNGEKIGEISIAAPGVDMLKADGSAFVPVTFSPETAVSKFDSTKIEAEENLENYDRSNPKTFVTESGDFVYYDASGDESGLTKHRVSDDTIVERGPDFDVTSPGYSMDGDHLFLWADGELKVFDTEGLDRVDESSLDYSRTAPVLIQEENQTKVYTGDDSGLIKGFTFDGNLTEDWSFDTGDGRVVEAVGMGDAIVASTDGDTYGINRHTGEPIWSVEDELGTERGGRLGFPYSNFLPLADKQGGFSVLEFETGQLDEGGTANLRADWELPETAEVGNTVNGRFIIKNSGDGSVEGDVSCKSRPEDSETYEFSFPFSLGANDEVTQSLKITPYNREDYDEGFEASYEESSDTVYVDIPVSLGEDGENQVTFEGILPAETDNSETNM